MESNVSVAFKITVDKYEQMIRTGILGENDPVELIRGELVAKMPIGPSHSACVNRLIRLLPTKLSGRAIVGIQNPIRLSDSEPEPDAYLAMLRDDCYENSHPAVTDLLLVIEVADSSLEFDRTVKLSLYAEAGIREYWIVNLLDEQLEVYRGPQPSGEYREPQVLHRGEEAEPLALPGAKVAVADIFN